MDAFIFYNINKVWHIMSMSTNKISPERARKMRREGVAKHLSNPE